MYNSANGTVITIMKDYRCNVSFPQFRRFPFFVVYCRTRFLILGRSVGKRKKKHKNKIGKLSGARRPGTSA